MDAGSRTVIIGDSNAPVDFESLGTVISRPNPRNHFPPDKALYWAVATPQMPPTFDAPRIVSLGSGIAWLAVGLIPVVRTRLASRLERGLAATAFFLAGWAFLDALYPVLSGTSPDLVFIGFRLTFITFGTLALLLTVKWVARGPSRYDPLLVLPVIGSLGLAWTELPARAGSPSWGYGVWAAQQIAYVGASLVLTISSVRGRAGPSTAFRWRSIGTLGILLAVVGNFVETSVPLSAGYAVTAMRYEGLGIVAVRGEFVIVAAVYDGPAHDALRGELTRALKTFEERSRRQLGTWEDATSITEEAANELSNFLEHPERTVPPRLPKVSPDVKLRKAS